MLLVAYVFDITASKTKVPSVIFLLVVGWAMQQAATYFQISIPDLHSMLPILGTIGLILIVLEGSLELELNHSKIPLIKKSALAALVPIVLFSAGLALAFHHYGQVSFKTCLANAIPLAIISSAIAIPSAQNLLAQDREFVTYESSLSDIFGVLFFNFIVLNEVIDGAAVGYFLLEIFLILIITAMGSWGIASLLTRINHHVKFIPIMLMLVLIYAVLKAYHLPGLIFILLFGLFVGNITQLKSHRLVQLINPIALEEEVHKFKELTVEIAFSVRALFFLLFGFLIQTQELLNRQTMVWAICIVTAIFVIRLIILKTQQIKIAPLVFMAPRGLITILLFLSIPATQSIPLANKSLIIQVVVLTALTMMVGLMTNNKSRVN
jgi:hypothetical protein